MTKIDKSIQLTKDIRRVALTAQIALEKKDFVKERQCNDTLDKYLKQLRKTTLPVKKASLV